MVSVFFLTGPKNICLFKGRTSGEKLTVVDVCTDLAEDQLTITLAHTSGVLEQLH